MTSSLRHTAVYPLAPTFRQWLLPLAVCAALSSLSGCGGGSDGDGTATSQAVEAPLLFSASAPRAVDGVDGSYLLNTQTGQLFGPKAKGQWPLASIQLTGPQGPVGAAGADGAALLNGSGVPDVSLGKSGDFYLNTGSQQIYGPKANGVWPASGVGLVGPMGQAGVNGVDGVNGINGTNGSNGTNGTNGTNGSSLLNGAAAPHVAIGAVGDFYIDTTTSTLYGPKTASTWPAGISLKGSDGVDGTNGTNGNGLLNGVGLPGASTGVDGDFYLNTATTTLYGPKAAGAWPSIGVSLVGSAGTNGANGTNGSNGTNGTNGTNGNTILNGSGSPSAGTGGNGDFYIDTATTTLYGPKAAGAWPGTGVSLIGSGGSGSGNGNTLLNGTGAPSNSTGSNGDFYIDTTATTLYGPKLSGVWGSGVSMAGAAGAAGSNGTNGTNGTNGNRILTGSSAPGAGTGSDGDLYIQTGTGMLFVKDAGSWGGGVQIASGSSSGASLHLLANKVGGSGETLPTASTTTPALINFNNTVSSGFASTGNTWNGSTGTFTVGSSGAGLYYIQSNVHTPDASPATNTVSVSLIIEINGASYGAQTGSIIYGVYTPLNAYTPAGTKGRGAISTMLYLNAGDTFKIKGISSNSSVAAQPISADAGSNLMVVKMN